MVMWLDSEECASSAESANDVMSHIEVYAGLTISRNIRCPPLFRMKHLLHLKHRKLRLMVAGLDTISMLTKSEA